MRKELNQLTRVVHNLKSDPEMFKAHLAGTKTFDIRFDDRDFRVGHYLRLRETEFSAKQMQAGKPLRFTGRVMFFRVVFVLRGPHYGLQERYCCMALVEDTDLSDDSRRSDR